MTDSKKNYAPSVFLNEIEGKYGPVYTNKDNLKRKESEPVITVYPTTKGDILKVRKGDADDMILANQTHKDKDLFITEELEEGKTTFLKFGESKFGKYLRVSSVDADPNKRPGASSGKGKFGASYNVK